MQNTPPDPERLDALGVVSLSQLLAESETPTDWLIEGIYPRGEAILVSGPSHSGKTYVLLDQGLAVAYGAPWLGAFDVPEPRPVLYAPSEGRRGVGRRVRAIVEHRYDGRPFPEFHLFGDRLNLTDPSSGGKLYRAAEETGAALVIIDVLRDATPGVAENSDEMGDAFGLLRDLAHETGATFLVAHHLGKDTSKGSRGHSSLKDKADQEVLVTASAVPNPDGGILWTSVRLKNAKNRNEDNWGTLALDLRRPEGAVAPLILGTAVGAAEAEGAKGADPSYLAAILDLTKGAEGSAEGSTTTVRAVAEYVKRAEQSARETLKRMAERGFVDIDKTKSPHAVSLTGKGRRAAKVETKGQTTLPSERRKGRHPLGDGHPSDTASEQATETILAVVK